MSGADEMASAEELYARWLESAPTEAGVGDVEKVLERYLPGRWRRGTKHQYVVEHRWLKLDPAFRAGRLTIAAKQGRTVVKKYLSDLARAIRLVEFGRAKGYDENQELS